MVRKEFYKTRKDGINLYRSYSDEKRIIIRNDGIEFDDAIDVEDSQYTYIESEKFIEEIEEIEEIEQN